jgi:hypothetical protein
VSAGNDSLPGHDRRGRDALSGRQDQVSRRDDPLPGDGNALSAGADEVPRELGWCKLPLARGNKAIAKERGWPARHGGPPATTRKRVAVEMATLFFSHRVS